MSCSEVQELLGAFALDALDAEEQAEVRAHLATCNLHDEVAELAGAASVLAFAASAETPSAQLRERLLAGLEPAARPAEVQEAPPFLVVPRQSRRLDWAPYALAAAFALISLGLLVWNVALLSGNGDSDTRVVLLTGTGGSGAVVFDGDDATLELAGMDALDAASDYQAWLIEDGVPVPVGVLQVSAAGEATQSLGASLPANAVVAVTIEPAGGSAQPTSAPILSGEL